MSEVPVKPKAVLVTWVDAVSHDPWVDIEEIKNQEVHTIHTLGFLLSEDDRKIVLAASWDVDNEHVASTWSIPKTWLMAPVKEIDLGESNPCI